MKKWPLIVALLYAAILYVLLLPLSWVAFLPQAILELSDYTDNLGEWQTWMVLAIMVIAQFAILRVPVAAASGRPVRRRSIWVTAIAAAFMMGLLVLGGALSLMEWIDRMEGKEGDYGMLAVLISGLLSWVFWAIYFYRKTSASPVAEMTPTLQKYLWRGSILELLIAVPTHIVVRQRDDCCAGFLTFIGLTCGVAVMLFAFGPSLYFLFAARWRRLHPSERDPSIDD